MLMGHCLDVSRLDVLPPCMISVLVRLLLAPLISLPRFHFRRFQSVRRLLIMVGSGGQSD